MNITIVGAGNIGTQLAVHAAEKGHNVIVYGSKPKKINKILMIVNEEGKVIHKGQINKATNNERIAFSCADLIFITMPSTMMKINADKIYPFVNSKLKICLVPGTGGGECAFKECIKKGATVFGLQRVPSVARLIEYGNIVRAVGYREELYVASFPKSKVKECGKIIESIMGIKTIPLPNYLNITLTPSNPILHTTRLKNIYGDYCKGKVYKEVPLFYEDWDDETSKDLLKCDDEVQIICKKLYQFDLHNVHSLRIHYESSTAEAMTKKIRSIHGFRGLKSPAVKTDEGYIPDFNSRYFTADFSFGLTILIQIADMVDAKVEKMREILEWFYNICPRDNEFMYSDYGINNLSDFIEFYSQ